MYNQWLTGKSSVPSVSFDYLAITQAQLDFFLQFRNGILEYGIRFHQILHGLAGINYGTVISTAKIFSDGF